VTHEHRTSITAFTTVPNPSNADYADAGSGNGVTLDIPPGTGVGHSGVGGSGSRSRLLDGLGITSLGNLGQVFAFADPGNGRLRMDLQTTLSIGEINTFSTHEINERIAQNYSVYGSTVDLPGTGDLGSEGWNLIATVAQDYNAGIAGVSLHNSSPGVSIGRYRYLLFEILPSFDNEATEYYEIDVVEAVVTDYDIWTTQFPGFTNTVGTADQDGDGLVSDKEYLFGLDPTLVSSANPFVATLDPLTGTFSYTRRDPSLTGFNYTVLVSTDIQNWETAVNPVITPGTPDPVSHVEVVTVGLNELPVDGKLFVTVQASQ
jgi:hypothetical protein